MLIERLEFIGFGNLAGQRVDFKKDKVNVLVESNDYGKSTIAEAIWAILYDYPQRHYHDSSGHPDATNGASKKPLSGAAFKGCLDIELGQRRLRIIRDFALRSVKILDLSKDLAKAEADVTGEFMNDIEPHELGLKLTGLGLDLFRNTCIIGQRELDKVPFDRSLSTLLLNIADAGGAPTTAASAIACLEETMLAFPFKGQNYKLPDLIQGLERGRELLVERLKQLETERAGVSKEMEKLSELEERLNDKIRDVDAEEYFQLCLEAADLDGRLMKANERGARIEELRRQMAQLAVYEHFPVHRIKLVDELWTKRASRYGDLHRLRGEMDTKRLEAEMRDMEFRERSEGLSGFLSTDAQALATLGRTLQQVFRELEEARAKREREYQRVRGTGVDFNSLAGVRKSMLTLEAKELDDAQAFHNMIRAARERIVECESAAEKARAILTEIQTARTSLSQTFKQAVFASGGLAVLCGLALAVMLASLHSLMQDPAVVALATISGILLILTFMGMGMIAHLKSGHRKNEEEQVVAEEERQGLAIADLYGKIRTMELRMEELSTKAGARSGYELMKSIHEYATAAAQLKDLDVLEQLVNRCEAQVASLTAEIQGFFQRAGRLVERVTPKSTLELADEINRYLDECRRKEHSSELLDHRSAEVKFLEDEIKDLDSWLYDDFVKAGINFDNIEDGYNAFIDAGGQYRKWETCAMELDRLSQDTTSDLTPEELPRVIERLEGKRRDIWGRMQQLIVANPQIVSAMAPVSDTNITSVGKEMSDLKASVESLRRQRDEATVQLRAATKNFHDYYLKTLQELESVEKDLDDLKQAKTALTLARDTFLKLAEENHALWARKLTEISREMLKHLGTEYDSLEFDNDLKLTVRKRGQKELLRDNQFERLSSGTREQVHCLARMAVARFLAKDYKLPIVLDEPFSEFDDERFVKIMKFLATTMTQQNQIIIFSCHRQRHQWLLEQLSAKDAQRIALCRLEYLKADAVARR